MSCIRNRKLTIIEIPAERLRGICDIRLKVIFFYVISGEIVRKVERKTKSIVLNGIYFYEYFVHFTHVLSLKCINVSYCIKLKI